MSDELAIDLYKLLPYLYLLRDADQGYPLRALLDIIAGQADITKRNIDGLWDDFFIETCSEWVIPYIGDLVGNNPIHEVAQRRRVDIAKTISYRRRKGTLPMLEELARDVTGWGAHAVAFFELLSWTQNLNHLRYRWAPNPASRDPDAVDRVSTVHLRNLDALDLLDSPFDTVAHTVDVRPICRTKGWYNIRKVGFYLWRLQSYPLRDIQARPSSAVLYGYHISASGNPTVLFTNPEREASPEGLATEIHVPNPIRPFAIASDLNQCRLAAVAGEEPQSPNYSDWADKPTSLSIWKDGNVLHPQSLVCMDLSNWHRPPQEIVCKDADGNDVSVPIEAGVDVRLGRLVFAVGKEPAQGVEVSYCYGFSANMGAGPYDQRSSLFTLGEDTWYAVVKKQAPDSLPPGVLWKTSLEEAIEEWQVAEPERALIEIWDNGTYAEPVELHFSGMQRLVIQAKNKTRPMLRCIDEADALAEAKVMGNVGRDAALELKGLLIEGGIRLEADSLGEFKIVHCTLIPGRELDEAGRPLWPEYPSITVEEPNASMELLIDHSIVGALRLPEEMQRLKVVDSVIDAGPDDVALPVQALLSGNLATFPQLQSNSPLEVQVTIGNEGPFLCRMDSVPESLADACDVLGTAIRGAHCSEAFTRAAVGVVGKRLVVLPGFPNAAITFTDTAEDDTATKLRLVDMQVNRRDALISARLSPSLTLDGDTPTVHITIGGDGPYPALITSNPTSLAQARDSLQQAIRNAHIDSAFTSTRVINVKDFMNSDRLLILPGQVGKAVVIEGAPNDPTTVAQLRFRRKEDVHWLAIAKSDTGDQHGPGVTLERTTVFGGVLVKELTLASDVIFTFPVVAARRQSGCVRFSYFPDLGSQVPRRYRCQADIAFTARAEQLGLGSADELSLGERTLVRSKLKPSFTSIHYGDPGYAQLSSNCPLEIRKGAEDGSEMGAYNHLKQPQREVNLRIRLEEYLPFGLEPGIICVT